MPPLHPDTTTGPVHLTVSDLLRALHFYVQTLGFRVLQQQGHTALLAADGTHPLVALTENPQARRKPQRSTGLYHFAILTPNRPALGRSLRRLFDMDYPLQGASDHGVSEALYLADPDGNGIEIYVDRPRARWPRQGERVHMVTEPLDLDSLLREVETDPSWEGLDAATRIGHVHLHVADLNAAAVFYCDVLGFDLILRYGGSALFVSAGGYHHHLGLNTWAGVGAPPPPPDAVGLRYYTLLVPNRAELERLTAQLTAAGVAPHTWPEAGALHVSDPSGNGIILTTPDVGPLTQLLLAEAVL